MSKYRVVWIVHEVLEEQVEANSVGEAKAKWEAETEIFDNGELFFIEDEQGNQVVY